MKKEKIMALGLGLVTGIGGFLEVGSIGTAAQAGAMYGFRLIWAIALGCLCGAFLLEMSGRLALVSRHTVKDAIRERFGFPFYALTQVIGMLVDLLVVAAETGGVCIALQLVSGISYRWWAVPVALAAWALIWFGTYGMIQNGVSALGLVTLVFFVAMLQMHSPWKAVATGLAPLPPHHDTAHYWFSAVSIVGASITPYLLFFYSSGAVEDKWDASFARTNKIVAASGMLFGGILSISILVVCAMVFQPRGIQLNSYSQIALMLTPVYARWGFLLFVASLAIGSYGALLQASMASAYSLAQGFGWNWGENLKPGDDARFSLCYSAMIFISALFIVAGIDPLKLTNFSMALAAAILPLITVPFLIIMNDPNYVHGHENGWIANAAVIAISVLTFVIALVTIPLEILGS